MSQGLPLVNGRSEVRKMLCCKAVDPVVSKGVSLAQGVVSHVLGEEMRLLQDDQVLLCLRNCVVEVLDKHAILLTSCAKRLARTPESTSEAFVGVSNELFLNGCVTWNRIIVLYALAGRLALYYQENNMHKLAESIPQYMTHCIAEKMSSFVQKNGGWVRIRFSYKLHAWFRTECAFKTIQVNHFWVEN
jgi:hypothetical protein